MLKTLEELGFLSTENGEIAAEDKQILLHIYKSKLNGEKIDSQQIIDALDGENISYQEFLAQVSSAHKTLAHKLFKNVDVQKLGSARAFEKLEEFALNFGMLFQIYDDIIDCTLTTKELGKTAGKDQEENKLTYVKIHGLDKAKNIFYSLIDKNHGILDSLNVNSKIFKDIHESLITKVKK